MVTTVALVGFFGALALGGTPANAQSALTVNTTVDEYDVSPNATCSLREAITSANGEGDFGGCVVTGAGGPYTINLAASTYTLSIAGENEDLNVTGDLDITRDVIIEPPPGDATTVDAGALDRVFDVHPVASLTLNRVVIRNGSATADGGCVRVIDANFHIDHVVIEECETTNNGGGIFADTGVDITIVDSEIRNNAVDIDANGANRGGALYIADPGAGNVNNVLIERSTLFGNFGDDFGGAISTLGTTTTNLTIRNSTISGNSTNSSGGGISSGGPTTLDAVTVTGNTSNLTGTFSGGGGLRRVNGILTIRSSIIAGNQAALNECDDLSGTAAGFVTQGANLIGENTCLEAAFPAGAPNGNGDWVGTDPTPIDPFLGPLADNGGPTRTHAVLEGSLARNNGNTTLPVDQRGALRDATPEIGSYEFGVVVAGAPRPAGGSTHALSAPTPNPATGQVRFSLSVAAQQSVDVAVFDVTGRRVAVLHQGAVATGAARAFALNAAALGAGVYIIRVRGELFEDTRRLVVIR